MFFSDSVPGRRSLLRLHDDWLGSSLRHDRSLGGRHGAEVQSVKVRKVASLEELRVQMR